jgi:hypothetical protein
MQYEDQLAFECYMRFAIYLRLFKCNYGILYNPYDTDYAGFSVFLNWALRLDLESRSHWIDLQIGKRECPFPIATWVVVFVAKYVLGLRWYSDLLTAIQEAPLCGLVGLEEIPSDRSISRAHEDLHPRLMKRAYRDWMDELQRRGRLSGWLIAIDSTFLVIYGKTYQRVGRSYKPKGSKGYRLTLAYDVMSCQPICFLLAPANRHDSRMLLKAVNEVERFLGPNPGRIYLFDKGYWKGASFQVLDEQGIRFITQVKWYANITRTLDAQLAAEPMAGRQMLELIANADGQDVSDFKGLLRVIAIDDRRGKLAQQEAEKEDPEDTCDEVQDDQARPFCLLTNVWDISIHRLARCYQRRWELEEFIRQAKQAWHLNTFCNTDHNAIKTHIWLLFYSYSLIRLFRRQVMGKAGWSNHAVGWLRRHLFIRSGWVCPLPGGGFYITFSHPRQHDPGMMAFLAGWCHQQRVHLIATLMLLALILEAVAPSLPLAQALMYAQLKGLCLRRHAGVTNSVAAWTNPDAFASSTQRVWLPSCQISGTIIFLGVPR